MSVTQIPSNEVDFHPLSFGDPNGRLFWWKQELYRGIANGKATLYKRILKEGIVQRLIEKELLIETEPTPFTLDNYTMVLRHRLVPFVSYPYEWCASMLKDAALTVIDVEIELIKNDLTLQDAHPWNVLFDGYKPIYVDFGSIVPTQANVLWPAMTNSVTFLFIHYSTVVICIWQPQRV